MAVDERSRHELYQRLEGVLGPDAATTLMSHLPPVGWADVATKGDLQHLEAVTKSDLRALEERLDARFVKVDARFTQVDARFTTVEERLEARFDLVEQKIERSRAEVLAAIRGEIVSAVSFQTRTMVVSFFAAVVTSGSLVLAAARLA